MSWHCPWSLGSFGLLWTLNVTLEVATGPCPGGPTSCPEIRVLLSLVLCDPGHTGDEGRSPTTVVQPVPPRLHARAAPIKPLLSLAQLSLHVAADICPPVPSVGVAPRLPSEQGEQVCLETA